MNHVPDEDFAVWYDRWLAAEPHWLDGAAYVGDVEGQPQHLLGLEAWQAMTRWVSDHGAPLVILLTCEAMER